MRSGLHTALIFFAFFAIPVLSYGIRGQQPEYTEKVVSLQSGGWELIGDLRIPETGKPAPAVLLLNRANGTRGEYAGLAASLARLGIASLRLDLRAHGESTNKGRFGPPFDEKMRALLVGSEDDVQVALEFLKSSKMIDSERIGVAGGSYSGEQMVVAARRHGYEKAYVALSPGSFSDESIASIDKTGIPWFFVRSVDEIALMNEVFAAVRKGSKTAGILEVPGSGHASQILSNHPEINDMIAAWFKAKL